MPKVHKVKAIGLGILGVLGTILILLLGFIGLVLWQDRIEDNCEKEAHQRIDYKKERCIPYSELSEDEKDLFKGIKPGSCIAQIYLETLKCMRRQ